MVGVRLIYGIWFYGISTLDGYLMLNTVLILVLIISNFISMIEKYLNFMLFYWYYD